MSIEKNTPNILRHENISFTTLINDSLHNIKNDSALGIYCYLASKPPGWNISKTHLQNHFGRGRTHVETCIKYLKEIGAIKISIIRDKKGRIIGWETTLRADFTQNTRNPYSGDSSRIPENQNLVEPESGQSTPINKRLLENKDNNKNIYKGVFSEETNFEQFEDENEMCFQREEFSNFDFEENEEELEEGSFEDYSLQYSELGLSDSTKSDYKINQLVSEKNTVKTVVSKAQSLKSDYLPNQTLSCTDNTKTRQLGLNHILDQNPNQIPESLIQDWLEVRKKKRAPVTQTAWDRVNKELEICKEKGYSPQEAFEIMVSSGWQGLDAQWIIKRKEGFSSKLSAAEERIANEEKIRERELAAQAAKRKEIEDSKNFKTLLSNAQKISIHDRLNNFKQELKASGMNAPEYHKQLMQKRFQDMARN